MGAVVDQLSSRRSGKALRVVVQLGIMNYAWDCKEINAMQAHVDIYEAGLQTAETKCHNSMTAKAVGQSKAKIFKCGTTLNSAGLPQWAVSKSASSRAMATGLSAVPP